jgi:hypothetical protein
MLIDSINNLSITTALWLQMLGRWFLHLLPSLTKPAEGGSSRVNYLWGKLNPMEHLQQRLDALKQQEANLLMQLDEVRVLISSI